MSGTSPKKLPMLALTGVLLTGHWALAHHSLSIYESDRDFRLSGVATEFLFNNPHAVVRFEVRDASGNVEQWSAETSGVRRLETAGWSKETIKPGDQVTVIGRVSKDGSKKMFMEKIIVNGKEWERGRR